ncbi:trifunctional MMPL family transporter/lysophospholipid acyltransferase/class I SAM-dependent methyltransferase [Chryseolinea lacunae]|uniref:1-acyl-sn-glycerol-3-phosphate acyltransferase n=1 Tax=Chryseolinea lacunae TaxID=2801331 RepID=A0ABS1KSM9_9BACT|nr:trifunctional MMPL family transporter/lysophospholipid acyltransferase/class I SAM-dependent methyltransferase [Chryseolinea lacunae]MBL0741291.1 1-acyl-sn-glycerol-3-phosphate acyltransferase [Chryseolinea lacunae]
MAQLFLSLYDFFQRRKPLFWTVFVGTVALLAVGASRITLEEDITKFFPDDPRVEKLNYVFQNSKFVERMVVMVSMKDSTTTPDADSLIARAETIVTRIHSELKPYVKQITTRVDDEKIMEVFKSVHDYLPIFLTEDDYAQLDSLSRPEKVRSVLEQNYQQLISPAGMALKKIIVQDPLGFSFLALKKLRQLQYDENFELYDSYIVTKDHRHLLFFLQPVYGPSETGKNTDFVAGLEKIMQETTPQGSPVMASYFGASAVAVGNATQLRKDSMLTVSIMVVLLGVLLIGYFRKKRVPFLIFIPVAFGGVFSLCGIYLVQGTVSILALAAGAVILGIAVNYSLHFLAHLKHTHDVKTVIKDLTAPMTLGSTTTVLAFFCLQFANAAVLRDVGLFAGFSLIGAALCSLIFLPHFLSATMFPAHDESESRLERMLMSFESPRVLVLIIFLATPVFLYFAQGVSFNSDMGKLNFMHDDTRNAQVRLETINNASLGAVYVVSTGNTLEAALRKNEQATPVLQTLKDNGTIHKFSSVSLFLLSDSLQRLRIDRWNVFWTPQRKASLLAAVNTEATALKFSQQVIGNFEHLITKEYHPATRDDMSTIRDAFFDDYIIEKDGRATVISLANVDAAHKAIAYAALKPAPVQAFDRQMLTNLFVEYVHADFNFIVTFTALLVFSALFLSYGRIELTFITFVPMFITWIWILGIMALVGIEFNIINVMVSTFIFGLGDDYSIFIMDGLQQDYAYNRKNLPSIRASIFLSAVTTIAGLGVLIFAKHPALRSIAAISIIGIVCVFVMAQTLEPFLFRWLITNRTKKGFTPMTWAGIFRTTFTYGFFVTGAFVLTLIGFVLRLIPVGKKSIRIFFHTLIRWLTWSVIYMEPNVRKRIIGKAPDTFLRAHVIIANHASFLDILLTTMLHPKLILLTNKWVWNSPVFGGVVRLADYYPVSEGAEDSIDRLKDRVGEGYSVVVFPEGTRSEDGKLKRFHKGAFFMAQEMNVPIQPLLIHGASDAIPKGTFYLNPGQLTLKFLPPIEPDDARFGATYSERTKGISRHFKQEYAALAREIETADYFSHRLISNYLYKGPVLEWYMRVKLRLEKNYAPFHRLIPLQATILDLGCGYGFLSYMLQFLSADRVITGVDYDEEKIETAQNGYQKTDRLNFFCADVTQFPLATYDVIIISDVLHYLPAEAQEALLVRCFHALHAGGKLIVRDGNADLKERHKGTQLTEFFSVKVLKFNKSTNALNFVSGQKLTDLARRHGLKVAEQDDAKFTSNVIFVMEKP